MVATNTPLLLSTARQFYSFLFDTLAICSSAIALRIAKSCLLCLAVILPAAARAENAAATNNQISFNHDGLSSIQVKGSERLFSGKPSIWRMKTPSGVTGAKPLTSTFDELSRKYTTAYEWGSVVYTYTIFPQGLRITTEISNTGSGPINELGINLLSLRSLGDDQKLGKASFGVEGPPLVQASGSEGSLAFSREVDGKPLMLDFSAGIDGSTKTPVTACRAYLGDERVLLDNLTGNRTIPPGGHDNFTVELRFGSPGSKPLDLAQDFVAYYRQTRPELLNWPDRRPILRLFFNGGLPPDQALANLRNPESTALPSPDAKFRDFVLGRIKTCVEAAKAANAQGVLLWDLEGNTFPHPVTYIGDPQLIGLFNPQMEMVIDEGIEMLKQAGLRVGVTVRPSHIVYSKEKNTVVHSHTDAKDPFLELDAKIAHAKKRWSCTLFYVDTNYFWRQYGSEKKWQSGALPPELWQRLHNKYPDTLFIPEIADYADYQAAAGYGEADMGDWGTPELVRAIWPNSFRLIAIEDADPYVNFDRFVACVRDRNILTTYPITTNTPWFQGLLHIEREAALLNTGVPAVVGKTKPEKLANLLKARDVASRFYAARRLAESPVNSAAPALLERAQDPQEEWVVRRASILALAKLPCPRAIPVLLDLAADHQLGLYAAASTALAGQGTNALGSLMQRLEPEAKSGTADPTTIETLGSVLLALNARDQAPHLQELIGKVPEGKGAVATKRSLLSLMGKLHNPETEPFLLTELNDSNLEVAAAGALARLGSRSGVAEVNALLEQARKDGNVALLEKLKNALQQK
jgi:hypothetical protein